MRSSFAANEGGTYSGHLETAGYGGPQADNNRQPAAFSQRPSNGTEGLHQPQPNELVHVKRRSSVLQSSSDLTLRTSVSKLHYQSSNGSNGHSVMEAGSNSSQQLAVMSQALLKPATLADAPAYRTKDSTINDSGASSSAAWFSLPTNGRNLSRSNSQLSSSSSTTPWSSLYTTHSNQPPAQTRSGSAGGGGQPAPSSNSTQVARPMITYRPKTAAPTGQPPYDFGPGYVHGFIKRPTKKTPMPNLPAKCGLGMQLNPAPLRPNSCIPPQGDEPLAPVDPAVAAAMYQHDARRIMDPNRLTNRVVYDSIDPCPHPTPKTQEEAPAPAPAPGEFRPWYQPISELDHTLSFESRFECGNLRRVIQVKSCSSPAMVFTCLWA